MYENSAPNPFDCSLRPYVVTDRGLQERKKQGFKPRGDSYLSQVFEFFRIVENYVSGGIDKTD